MDRETAAVAFLLSVPAQCAALAAALLLWSPWTRAALACYVLWSLTRDSGTPYRGGRVVEWARRLGVWRAAAAYFPLAVHTTTPPLSTAAGGPVVLAAHPHGVLSLSVVLAFVLRAARGDDALAGLDWRVGTVTANTALPLWRDLLMAMGFVNAHRGSLDHCLRSGLSVVLVPGGAREALHAHPGRADLVLACRKGFVKLALAHGARLVPVFCFGETELYSLAPSPAWLQDALRRLLGFSVPLAYGRGCCSRRSTGPLPRRVPLNIVVGAPLALPVLPNPTAAQLDVYHAQYVAALRALYDAHAPRFCPQQQQLDAAAGVEAQPRGGACGESSHSSPPLPSLTVVQ